MSSSNGNKLRTLQKLQREVTAGADARVARDDLIVDLFEGGMKHREIAEVLTEATQGDYVVTVDAMQKVVQRHRTKHS